jgi:hypothetical protein
MAADEINDFIFRPIAVVARRRVADEAAVAAVGTDAKIDVRVARDLRIVEGL